VESTVVHEAQNRDMGTRLDSTAEEHDNVKNATITEWWYSEKILVIVSAVM